MSIQISGVYGGGSKINGVKGEYLATANIAKGDFVQLTTKGVEEVAFTEVTTIETIKDARLVSAAILSPTKAIIAIVERSAPSGTAPTTVCVQALHYVNGTWTAGTKLVISNHTGGGDRINVCRLSESKAMLIYTNMDVLNSGIYVLDVTNENITVESSLLDITYFSGGSSGNAGTSQIVSVALTDDTVVMMHEYSSNGIGYAYPWVITYKNGTISTQRLSNLSRATFTLSICKLNDQTALLSKVATSSDYAANYRIITVVGESVAEKVSMISAGTNNSNDNNGKIAGLRENAAIMSGWGFTSPETAGVYLLEYDPDTGTLKKSDMGIKRDGEYRFWEGHKMSDTEMVVLASTERYPEDADDNLYLSVIDVETGTCLTKFAPISAEGKGRYYDITYVGYGWMIAFSGVTSVLVAPLISQTTAAPYSTRLDGVASKGATAGQMAEVITPRIEGTSDEIHVSYPVVS